jgi:hypothetical protein
MNKILSLIFLFTFVLTGSSCTSTSGKYKKNLERRNLDEYFIGSGVVRYFLPDLPDWANYSQTASCKRQESIRYLHFNRLKKSFAMNYNSSVQLQYMFNREYKKLTDLHKVKYLPLKDEEKLFYDISDKINANIYPFRIPKFKRLHMIWIDPFLRMRDGNSELKKIMSKSSMSKGHPIFVSMCLNSNEILSMITKNKLSGNIRIIPHEMFSAFSVDGVMNTSLQLNFSEIIPKDKSIYLFLPKKETPKEFIGKFKIKRY